MKITVELVKLTLEMFVQFLQASKSKSGTILFLANDPAHVRAIQDLATTTGAASTGLCFVNLNNHSTIEEINKIKSTRAFSPIILEIDENPYNVSETIFRLENQFQHLTVIKLFASQSCESFNWRLLDGRLSTGRPIDLINLCIQSTKVAEHSKNESQTGPSSSGGGGLIKQTNSMDMFAYSSTDDDHDDDYDDKRRGPHSNVSLISLSVHELEDGWQDYLLSDGKYCFAACNPCPVIDNPTSVFELGKKSSAERLNKQNEKDTMNWNRVLAVLDTLLIIFYLICLTCFRPTIKLASNAILSSLISIVLASILEYLTAPAAIIDATYRIVLQQVARVCCFLLTVCSPRRLLEFGGKTSSSSSFEGGHHAANHLAVEQLWEIVPPLTLYLCTFCAILTSILIERVNTIQWLDSIGLDALDRSILITNFNISVLVTLAQLIYYEISQNRLSKRLLKRDRPLQFVFKFLFILCSVYYERITFGARLQVDSLHNLAYYNLMASWWSTCSAFLH